MDDNTRMINLLKQQKRDLETLYNNRKGNYEPHKLESLQVEIEDINFRMKKYETI